MCLYVVLWQTVVIKSKGCTHYDIKAGSERQLANGRWKMENVKCEMRKRKTLIKIQSDALAVIYVIQI